MKNIILIILVLCLILVIYSFVLNDNKTMSFEDTYQSMYEDLSVYGDSIDNFQLFFDNPIQAIVNMVEEIFGGVIDMIKGE